jgi:hypothetical protein
MIGRNKEEDKVIFKHLLLLAYSIGLRDTGFFQDGLA